VARILPAGFAGMDLFVLGIFAWGEIGFANVYYGAARRALDFTTQWLQTKRSLAIQRETYAHHPAYQQGLAEMWVELDGLELQLDAVARDWSASIAGAADWAPERAGQWGMRLVALKHRATNAAFRVVDRAIDLTGGFGVSRGGEIERLFRDVRMGRIHPANFALTHELVSKALLGIDLDDPQRFG
jgi:alkylation response protein AidB-like acyl-CoA dehydrogenase